MQIPDFPFANQQGPSFIHHSAVRQYLLDYAQYFDLYPHIKVSRIDHFFRLYFFPFESLSTRNLLIFLTHPEQVFISISIVMDIILCDIMQDQRLSPS